MSEPVFSILMTVFNTEKYLRECLDSVLSQTFTDYELVIVDDGSTDKSGKISDEYELRDKRVKVYHTANCGVLCARKTAFEKSHGKYILNIDSDDILSPELLQKVFSAIERDGSDMVFFDFGMFDTKGKKSEQNYFDSPRVFEEKGRDELFWLLLTTSFNSLCIKCYDRKLAEIQLDYDKFKFLKHGEDLLQSSYIVCNSQRASYINSTLYNYRTGIGSSNRFDRESFFGSSSVIEVINGLMKENGFENKKNTAELSRMCRKTADNYIRGLSSSQLSFREKKKCLGEVKSTFAYSFAVSHQCKDGFTGIQNLRFDMLQKNMYSLLLVMQSIKGR